MQVLFNYKSKCNCIAISDSFAPWLKSGAVAVAVAVAYIFTHPYTTILLLEAISVVKSP